MFILFGILLEILFEVKLSFADFVVVLFHFQNTRFFDPLGKGFKLLTDVLIFIAKILLLI